MLVFNKMRISYLIFLTTFYACIEPINVEIEGDGSNLLTVEGGITTEPGPHIIQLTRTAKFGSIFDGVIERERGALVSIRDNSGNIIFLDETFDGVYATDSSFRGVVGVSYTLLIETVDGSTFNSIPERIEPVPEIARLYAEYDEEPTQNDLQNITGMEVKVDFDDEPGVRNFIYWTYRGTYQINARPDLNIDPESGNVVPLECCTVCYSEEAGPTPSLYQDNTLDGLRVTVPVGLIQDDGVRFSDKYYIEVTQHSLSFEAFEFFELVNQQLSIDGDIFDPPPATIRGNVINIDRPDENVIGFFTDSDARTESMFITQEQLDVISTPALIRGDCRNYRPNATTTQPDFWF